MLHRSVKEKCGVFGIYGHHEAATLAYHGLYALQHRGQESAGIVSIDEDGTHSHLGMGLVADIFADPQTLANLTGNSAIGHNRYSTTGASKKLNIQPLLFNLKDDIIAIAHNGNLVNTKSLIDELSSEGAIFQTTTDTELIVHLIARSKEDRLEDRIKYALSRVIGAFSLVMLTKEKVIAARDPHGFRPLCLGEMKGANVFTSESCALDLINAKYVRDVEPGEMLVADADGLHTYSLEKNDKPHYCIFEFVYFSRPDSRVFGEFVDKTRRKLGKNLAEECGAEDADIVISVPDSSNTAALGFASRAGKRFEIGLIRNHYVGRTFINPSQDKRDFGVKLKFNTVGGVLKDRSIVVVEDSIVRGTTLKKLARLLRKGGAREIHVRVSSPPIKHPCFYGMDFPTRDELIANNMSPDEIRDHLEVDTLHYLSLEEMLSATGMDSSHFCTACFSGDYPVDVEEGIVRESGE